MAVKKSRMAQDDAYTYGNLVRIRQTNTEDTEKTEEKRKVVSPRVKKNQRRAMKLGFGYVTFFAGAVAVALFVCFQYLDMQANLDQKTRKIEALRTEITNMKEKNTSEYHYISNLVNLDEIKDRAEELGMVYGGESQIIKYQSAGDQEIRQYANIPEDGTVTDN